MFLTARARRGATLVEYGLLVMLVGVIVIGALTALGNTVSDPFAQATSALDSSAAGGAGGGGPNGPTAGEPELVCATGFAPGSDVVVNFNPVGASQVAGGQIATLTADGSGEVCEEITVPVDAPDGQYSFELIGEDPDGDPVTVSKPPITVDGQDFDMSVPATPPTVVAATPTMTVRVRSCSAIYHRANATMNSAGYLLAPGYEFEVYQTNGWWNDSFSETITGGTWPAYTCDGGSDNTWYQLTDGSGYVFTGGVDIVTLGPTTVYDVEFDSTTEGFNGTWNSGTGADGQPGYLVAGGYQHTGDYPAEPQHRYTASVDVRGAGCRVAISWWSNGGYLRLSQWATPASVAGAWTSVSVDDVPPIGGTHLKFYLDNGCDYDNFDVADYGVPAEQPSLGGVYSERFDRGIPTDGTAWGGTWNPAVGTGSAPGYLDAGGYPMMLHIPVEANHEYKVTLQAKGAWCRDMITWWTSGYISSAPGSTPPAAYAEWTTLTHTATVPASGVDHLRVYMDAPCAYDDILVEDLTGATEVTPAVGTVIYSTEFASDVSGWNGTWSSGAGYQGSPGYLVDSGYDHNNPIAITAGNRFRVTLQAKGASCKIGLAGWTSGGYVGPIAATGTYAFGEWTEMSQEMTVTNMGATHLRVYLEGGPCSYDHVVIEDLGTP